MLPTQFMPEYYADAKDIRWAEDAANRADRERRTHRPLLARLRDLFRRRDAVQDGQPTSQPGGYAH